MDGWPTTASVWILRFVRFLGQLLVFSLIRSHSDKGIQLGPECYVWFPFCWCLKRIKWESVSLQDFSGSIEPLNQQALLLVSISSQKYVLYLQVRQPPFDPRSICILYSGGSHRSCKILLVYVLSLIIDLYAPPPAWACRTLCRFLRRCQLDGRKLLPR